MNLKHQTFWSVLICYQILLLVECWSHLVHGSQLLIIKNKIYKSHDISMLGQKMLEISAGSAAKRGSKTLHIFGWWPIIRTRKMQKSNVLSCREERGWKRQREHLEIRRNWMVAVWWLVACFCQRLIKNKMGNGKHWGWTSYKNERSINGNCKGSLLARQISLPIFGLHTFILLKDDIVCCTLNQNESYKIMYWISFCGTKDIDQVIS